MNIGDRIKRLRKHLDLTQQKFGERIGIKGNTVAQYELGRNEPIDAVLSLICREYHVRKEWLQTGEGEMFEESVSSVMEKLRSDYSLNDFDYNFVYEYLKLSPERRAAVREFFRNVVAAEDGQREESTAERIDREVAEYRQELELEARQAEGLSAFDGDAAKKNA